MVSLRYLLRKPPSWETIELSWRINVPLFSLSLSLSLSLSHSDWFHQSRLSMAPWFVWVICCAMILLIVCRPLRSNQPSRGGWIVVQSCHYVWSARHRHRHCPCGWVTRQSPAVSQRRKIINPPRWDCKRKEDIAFHQGSVASMLLFVLFPSHEYHPTRVSEFEEIEFSIKWIASSESSGCGDRFYPQTRLQQIGQAERENRNETNGAGIKIT